MTLYFRLALLFLRCLVSSRIAADQTLVTRRRVWLNDLDMNFHLNTARYQSISELSLFEFFIRSGLLRQMMARGWRPMAGGCIATFRRQLKPFQAYEVHYRWVCSDDRWNYMAWEFVAEGQVCAAGYLKGGAVGPNGLVAPAQYVEVASEQELANLQRVLDKPLTEEVVHWRQADHDLYQHAGARAMNAG